MQLSLLIHIASPLFNLRMITFARFPDGVTSGPSPRRQVVLDFFSDEILESLSSDSRPSLDFFFTPK